MEEQATEVADKRIFINIRKDPCQMELLNFAGGFIRVLKERDSLRG